MSTANEIRKKYLDFFQKLNHEEIPSAPLVPENDTSTLFTSAGMQPLINYILGEPHPMGKRLVDSQKSFRTQDIMEVGDNRHTTFFEMLGNWSLGDYFKKEQLRWFFEWLTNNLGLDPGRLYVSVYAGNFSIGVPKDEESIKIWQELFKEKNIDAKVDAPLADGGRIFSYGDSKNWWSRSGEPSKMPVGEPGGPDSEVFFDFDPEGKNKFHENSPYKDKPCRPNCDCGRFLEIGNSVFMQYKKTEKGFEELSQKCVDFGGGLERITAAVNDTSDVFQTDMFLPIIGEIETKSRKQYSEGENARSMRIIADHLRASVFLITDGVYPSNKLQGYFLRRLLRRAMLYGNKLGFEVSGEMLSKVAGNVFEIYKNSPFEKQLIAKKDEIIKIILEEGEKFKKVSESKSVIKGIDEARKKIEEILGKYDTQAGWLPLGIEAAKIAFDLYQTNGLQIDQFFSELVKRGLLIYGFKDVQEFIEQEFEKLRQQHQELSRTASAGMFKGGLADSSAEVTKLHTATHLLHQALRTILGSTVSQKGSNITRERLRFDFNFDRKIEKEELKKVEELVNEQIKKELAVAMKVTTLAEAKKEGALANFLEKYGEKVKVYAINSFSKEVCGGPHVKNTKELGRFSIIKEESAGAGVRRIYAKLEPNE